MFLASAVIWISAFVVLITACFFPYRKDKLQPIPAPKSTNTEDLEAARLKQEIESDIYNYFYNSDPTLKKLNLDYGSNSVPVTNENVAYLDTESEPKENNKLSKKKPIKKKPAKKKKPKGKRK
jgi:hypothetical protein